MKVDVYLEVFQLFNPWFSFLIISNFFWNRTEAATGDVLYEKVLLEISQNSQENTYARVSILIKLQATSGRLFLIDINSLKFAWY